MTGNCSRCGRVETVFDVESTGERLCGRCITSPLPRDPVLYGTPGFDTPPDLQKALGRGIVTHGRMHFTEIPGCPECTQARRARI